MNITIALFLTLGAPSASVIDNCLDPNQRDYDVIVVGAGTGGISAAIQAARRPGTTVALIEETNQVGGQIVAAGVTSIDGLSYLDGNWYEPGLSGLYGDYRSRIGAHYLALGLSPTTCYAYSPTHTGTCSEPRVSRNVFLDMLVAPIPAGSSLCVFLDKKVLGVTKDASGNRVIGLTTTGPGPIPETWTSHVVIDATEYGDIIPLTGAEYRVGNMRTFTPLPTGQTSCIQDITQVAVIKNYRDLPTPPLAIPLLPDYTPQRRFEFTTMVSDDFAAAGCNWSWNEHNRYRGMPNSNPITPGHNVTRTGVNYANDYPGLWLPNCQLEFRDQLSVDFIEDPDSREDAICAARRLTLHFLYYMQEPGEIPHWSIADDEYVGPYASPNLCFAATDPMAPIEALLPPIPYVRESRRIVPKKTLTGLMILRPGPANTPPVPTVNNHPTSLAVGDYPTDVHNCDREEDLEGNPPCPTCPPPEEYDENLDDRSHGYGAFQIPFEAFIPKVIDGFLPAEKNLGYSRLASSAARLQPVTMRVGQAAGALAALAAKASPPKQPRDVRILDVQRTLLEDEDPVVLARQTFADVPMGHARWRDVQLAALYEVIIDFALRSEPSGYNWRYDFRPSETATRQVLVHALNILFGTVQPPIPSPDVTRADLAAAVYELKYGLPLPPNPPPPIVFGDVDGTTGPYAAYRGAIERLYNEGYLEPCSTTGPLMYCPGELERRDRLASLAAQIMLRRP